MWMPWSAYALACRCVGVWTHCLAGTIACRCVGMQAPGMCMQTWRTVVDQCKEKGKTYLLMWMLDGNVDAWACRRIGMQMRMVVDADVSTNKIYFFDHTDGCVRGRTEGRRAWCTHTDMDEGKGEKKEHTDLRWMRRADANECKKKKEKKKGKKNLPEMGACRREHVACGCVV